MICCDSVQEHGLALAFSNSCTCTYLYSIKAGAAAAAMDYMPPQFPTLPAESSDIFSLSDQILSERLEFIEEACSFRSMSRVPFDILPDRLALETGVVSGYAGPNLLLQKMALSDRLARKSLLNSFIGLKPQLLRLAFDHCGLRLLDVLAF